MYYFILRARSARGSSFSVVAFRRRRRSFVRLFFSVFFPFPKGRNFSQKSEAEEDFGRRSFVVVVLMSNTSSGGEPSKTFAGEAGSFPSSGPSNFDPSSPRADPVAFVRQREHETREAMIDIEKAKLIRERLRECYRREGVNHFENCKELVEKYAEAFHGKSLARINVMRDSK